jgi:nicotinamidase-related amidase
VINDLEFADGAKLLRHALPMARLLAKLKQRAVEAKVPVIYVNDNFGRWQSDFNKQVEHCLNDGVRGQPITELLRPTENDYFVLKPKHSGFYSTSLDILLEYLEVRRLIITGLATNLCVLFTASDAFLRDYELAVPADCSAANTAAEHRAAVEQMKQTLKADIRKSTTLKLSKSRAKKG